MGSNAGHCIVKGLFLWILVACLAACHGGDESDEFQEAIDVGRENVVSLQVVSDENKTLFEDGELWQFSVNAVRFDGTTFDATEQVQWSAADRAVASISGRGEFTAATVTGTVMTDVAATWGPLKSALTVTVSDADLVSIVASSQQDPIDECLTTELNAEGVYSDGSSRPLTDVSWSSNNPALARIDGNRLVALDSGNAEFVAQRANISSPPLAVVISDALNGLRFSVGNSLNARSGETQQLQTLGTYAAGEFDITAATHWTSADQSIVVVNDSGLLQGVSTGATTVSASCGGFSENLLVTVVDVSGIAIVDPEDADMEGGESRQLELFRVFSDGTTGTEDLAEDDDVVWDIDSGDEIASISATGEVTLVSDISGFEDSFIRVFAEFGGFENTLVIRLDN